MSESTLIFSPVLHVSHLIYIEMLVHIRVEKGFSSDFFDGKSIPRRGFHVEDLPFLDVDEIIAVTD